MGRHKGSKNKEKETSPAVENPETPENKTQEELPSDAKPAYLQRGSLLKEINDSNKERYASDNPDEQPGVHEDEPEQEESEAVEAQDEQQDEPEAPPKRKLIINGVEKEFTEEEVIALAQKNGAADAKLAEASRILEDAKRKSATNGADSEATQRDDRRGAQPSSDTSSEDDVANITKSLLYGTEEQVTQVVAKLLGRQKATPDQQQIRGLVAETIDFERAAALLETPPDQGGYSDIKSDPMLLAMFQQREDKLRKEGDTRSYQELYKSICSEIRTWKEELIKSHTPKTGLEDRDSQKRATGIVRGGGGKLPAPMESKPKTHDEVLSGMRAARGLN